MFKKLISKIAKEFNNNSIPYMIIGGQAVLIYGETRMTKDIDITLGIGLGAFEKITKIIKKLKLKILIKNPEEFVKKTYVLPLIHEKSKIRIDIIFSFSNYEKQAIKNGKKVKIGKTQVNFISLEDLIIHKIISGRGKDLDDVKNILLKNQDYNKQYIVKWLKEFDKSLNTDYIKIFTMI
ncbi:nucleotidyltransferase [bacterium]|nr:nucleotidyltransferase [bacterium]